jgi:hypothetical protein
MPRARRSGTVRVRVNDATFAEDLEHASPQARQAIRAARRELERDGIDRERLHPCESEHRDGTDLAGLAKSYLPAPVGPWGAVFAPGRDDEGRALDRPCVRSAAPPSPSDRLRRRAPTAARQLAARDARQLIVATSPARAHALGFRRWR